MHFMHLEDAIFHSIHIDRVGECVVDWDDLDLGYKPKFFVRLQYNIGLRKQYCWLESARKENHGGHDRLIHAPNNGPTEILKNDRGVALFGALGSVPSKHPILSIRPKPHSETSAVWLLAGEW